MNNKMTTNSQLPTLNQEKKKAKQTTRTGRD